MNKELLKDAIAKAHFYALKDYCDAFRNNTKNESITIVYLNEEGNLAVSTVLAGKTRLYDNNTVITSLSYTSYDKPEDVEFDKVYDEMTPAQKCKYDKFIDWLNSHDSYTFDPAYRYDTLLRFVLNNFNIPFYKYIYKYVYRLLKDYNTLTFVHDEYLIQLKAMIDKEPVKRLSSYINKKSSSVILRYNWRTLRFNSMHDLIYFLKHICNWSQRFNFEPSVKAQSTDVDESIGLTD